MMLTFDPIKHEYFWDGERVPGVSEILEAVGVKDSAFVKETRTLADGRVVSSTEFGTVVHEALAAMDRGTYVASEWDDAIEPYVRAWNEFKTVAELGSECRALPPDIELAAREPIGNYCGTIDRVYSWLDGRHGSLVLDIKTGQPAKWHSLQVGAYCDLVVAPRGHVIYLHETGKYTIGAQANIRGWRACLEVYNLRFR